MLSRRTRIGSLLPTALALCPLLTGPRTSAVYAECRERLAQKQADESRSRRPGEESARPAKSEKRSSPASCGGAFVSACVSKPTDGDSTASGLIPVVTHEQPFPPPMRGLALPSSQVTSIHTLQPPAFHALAPPPLL